MTKRPEKLYKYVGWIDWYDFLNYDSYEYKPPIVSDVTFNLEEASDEEIANFLNVPWRDYINSYKRIKATIYY